MILRLAVAAVLAALVLIFGVPAKADPRGDGMFPGGTHATAPGKSPFAAEALRGSEPGG